MDKLAYIHPGEVLREEFLTPLGVTAYRLAKSIGVPQTRIAGILKERRAVTADTALRLAAFLGTTPEFWLGLQALYDLEEAAASGAAGIAGIRPVQGQPVVAPFLS